MSARRIGPYEILEKIGSGGMGDVYLARRDASERVFAIKVLPASLAREPGFVDRFNREIEAMRKFKNPHIVELYESGVEGEEYYYAMEYVAGETLMSLMRREKRLPWQRAVDIAIQVCLALKAAHDNGVIHRDLKPSNLLVTPEGTVKLTDFGVAQVFASNRLTATGGIIGTAEYMSPEQAQGKRAGKQSDLYSLGAVMYAMIAGRTPFSGSTAVEVIQKHKFGLFDRPRLFVPDLPMRIEETICRLLEKDPDKRFPDALVLLRHLEQLVRLEDFSATGVTLTADLPVESGTTTVAADGGDRMAASRHPGPATLMKSLVRDELDSSSHAGWLSSLFNNTYFLVAVLALLVAGGYWKFRPHAPTPQEMFNEGARLLAQDPGSEWLRAKREFFEPLLERDADTWREPLAPLMLKIELYERSRKARGSRGARDEAARSEADRLLQLALEYRRMGDVRRAERTLAALYPLLAGDKQNSNLFDLTGQLLAEVRKQLAAVDDRNAMLESALDRAAAQADSGSLSAAREVWQGIIELYADDESAAEFVKRAR